jgi:hypothetical protein
MLPRLERHPQLSGGAVQPLVVRPQLCSGRQVHSGEQMGVDISDPAPEQRMALDEMKDLHVCRDAGMG